MSNATLRQGNQVLNLILQQNLSVDDLQLILETSLFTDVLNLDINYWKQLHVDEKIVARKKIQAALGLFPAFEVIANFWLPTIKCEINPFDEIKEWLGRLELDSVLEPDNPEERWFFQDVYLKRKSAPDKTFYSLVGFSPINRSDRPEADPYEVLLGYGYATTDMFDLLTVAKAVKDGNARISSRPITTLHSLFQGKRSAFRKEDRHFRLHPDLYCGQGSQLVFTPNGLNSKDYWVTDHLYLVRSPMFQGDV